MIFIRDNFLSPETFKALQEYCKNQFFVQKAGEKSFLVLPTPEDLIPLLQIEGHEMILTFIRKAHKDFDTDARIHNDGTIQGKKTALASVLYINDPEGVTPNGTSFFKHWSLGHRAPNNMIDEEFDRLITEDANDESKWERTDFISARPNRLLTYDSQLFHAKSPSKIEEGERVVLVSFFSKL